MNLCSGRRGALFAKNLDMSHLPTALHTLVRHRAYVCLTVLCLALGASGIGVAFTFLDALLVRPPSDVAAPEQLVNIGISDFPSFGDASVEARSLSGIAAASPQAVTLARGNTATEAQALLVSSSYFTTLGVRPRLGRFWDQAEDHPGIPLVMVLSYSTWQRLFGGDSSAIGTTINIAGSSATIIGVAPEGFSGTGDSHVDAFLPLQTMATVLGPEGQLLTNRHAHWLRVVGRLRPGVSLQQARGEIDRILDATDETTRGRGSARTSVVSSLMDDRRAQGVSQSLVIWLALLSAAGIIIACANVGTLNFTSVLARREEFWIRRALGASPSRLVSGLVCEATILGLIACPLALLLVAWAVHGLTVVMAAIGPVSATSLNPSALTFTLTVVATIIMTLACGVQGYVEVARRSTLSLKSGSGARATRPLIRSSVRRVVLSAQLAAVTALTVWAVIFAMGLRRASAQSWGINIDRLVILVPNNHTEPGAPPQGAKHTRLLGTLRGLPEVERFSVTSSAPFYSESFVPLLFRTSSGAGERRLGVAFDAVDSSYFETVGQRLLEGRDFVDQPGTSSPQVAIINRGLARRISPNESALGQCLKLISDSAPCRTIVGVVADVSGETLGQTTPTSQVFVPVEQSPFPADNVIVIRVRGSAPIEAARIRAAEASIGVSDVRAISELLEPQLAPLRIGTLSSWVVAAIGLLLTAIGLCGIVGYSVEQRRPELAIRSALGATNGSLIWLLVRELVIIVVAGLTAGTIVALAGQRLLIHWVLGLPPLGWLAMLLVTAVEFGAMAAFTLQPILRIRTVDPSSTLHI